MPFVTQPKRLPGRLAIAAALLATVTACGPASLPPGDRIADPNEPQNRAVHASNVAFDRAVLRPVSNAYGTVVPAPVRTGVGNFASNLDQPRYIVNDLLQFRIEDAIANTFRFALNSTVGLGGFLDPASGIGLDARETGFGETLHVYGLPEGEFAMLPLFGPATSRDVLGRFVDIATNPVRFVVPAPESRYITGAGVAERLDDRYEARGVIDGVLDDSVDSYVALRSLYVQNRRFDLRGPDIAFEDPYSDVADEAPASDPFSDPYFDPYAQ